MFATAPITSSNLGTCDDALLLLDDVFDAFEAARYAQGMTDLVSGLHAAKMRMSRSEWHLFRSNWIHHPLAKIVHQDPFTRWSYEKPRGYPGDAELLDFIYEHENVKDYIERAGSEGRAIYAYTKQAPAPVAVRERRDILGALVDRVAEERGGAIEILAVAAGHLREARESIAIRDGGVARWVAMDQDETSVVHVRTQLYAPCIRPHVGSVRGILGRRYELGKFDLIYAAGLYDYLAHNVAQRLTEILFAMLKPGGTLLFANFAKDIPDDGYMETFMDWHLIYRDEAEMAAIASGIPAADGDLQIFRGENCNIIYATLTKS